MKTLSKGIYRLIARAINVHGTCEPSVICYAFEEDLTHQQYNAIVPFLQWCHDNQKFFGVGNYVERYAEYRKCSKLIHN